MTTNSPKANRVLVKYSVFGTSSSAASQKTAEKSEKDCKKYLRALPPAFVILFTLAIVIYYILGPAEGYLHSDCTDTLWWAQASYDSGRLISDNFKYAALLPFGGNLLMLPFIPLFGVSMITHNIGMIIFAILFVAGLIFLGRSLGYGYFPSSILAFIVTLVLSSSDKLREIMWGHVIYYSLGLLFLCVGLSLVIRLQNKNLFNGVLKDKKTLILIIALFAFTAAAMTNGIQSFIIYLLPVAGALVLERIFADEDKEQLKARSFNHLAICGILTVSAVIGLLLLKAISHGVSAGYASAYSSYEGMNNWLNSAHNFFQHWFSLFGVSVEKGDPLVSLASVKNIIRIFTSLFLLAFPIISLFMYKKINSRGARLVLLSHFVLSALIMYAYLFGLLSSANWRLTPMLGSSAIASVVCAIELIVPKGIEISKRFGILAMCFLVLAPSVSAVEIAKMPADYGRDNNLHMLAEALEENGLKYGYAEFWLSQAITLLSDSKVKVRNIDIYSDGIEKYEYQSQYTWFDDQEGVSEYFLLVSDYHNSVLSEWLAGQTGITKTIPLSGYTVYVFDKNLF